jgi:hypothetical protein
MNQARNDDGSYDSGWYRDDQRLPPSLGVWPLGRTYVHSSDGALSTGHGAAASEPTPLYDGLAGAGAAPAGHAPSPPGRPPLYQVGGRYRGDDWPTDPGFRRGDLGLDDDPASDLGPRPGHGAQSDLGLDRPDLGRADLGRADLGRADLGRADLGRAEPGRGEPGRAERWQPGPEPVRQIRPDAEAQTRPSGRGRETWERNLTPAARVAAVEDAKLLAFLHDLIQRLKAVPSLYPRLAFLVVGYAAITSLAAAYAEAIPLPITASLIVIPAAGVIFSMGMRHPHWGRRALVGWIAGIIATIVYDGLRLALVKVGVWGDPIPGIGRLVLADPHANFAWGYLWRFLGNGGGMGIAYTMLPWRGVRTGIAYGTLICTGLVALLFFFPVAQVHFFPLTPVTTAGAYAGHWVYGAVLGTITSWWLPPVELGRVHGRLTARLIHPGHRPRPSHARSSAGASAAGPRRGADRRSA